MADILDGPLPGESELEIPAGSGQTDRPLRVGDVVTLRGQRVAMTVTNLGSYAAEAVCAWFVSDEPRSARYPIAALDRRE